MDDEQPKGIIQNEMQNLFTRDDTKIINEKFNKNFQKNKYMPHYTIPAYLGLLPYSEEDLKLIKDRIETLDLFLKKKNIRLMLVIPPNKHTIYMEYLPNWVISLNKKKSRMDQLIEFMNEKSYFKIHDYRSIFLKNKSNKKIYYKLDTHLNSEGNFLFYKELMKELNNPLVKSLETTDFNIIGTNTNIGDLSSLIGVPALFHDTYNELEVKKPMSQKCDLIDPLMAVYESYCYKVDNKALLSLLIYGDSYSGGLVNLLKENFKNLNFYFLGNHYDKSNSYPFEIHEKVIDKIKPDILIIETLERFIDRLKFIEIVKTNS